MGNLEDPVIAFATPIDLCNTKVIPQSSVDATPMQTALIGWERIRILYIGMRQLNGSFTTPLRPSQIAVMDNELFKLARSCKPKAASLSAYITKVNADLKAIPLMSLSRDR
jgi:hypothetical protein